MTDVYFVQNIDNSRVVRVADPRQRGEQRMLMGAIAVVFLLLFGYMWQNFQMVRLGYQIETMRHQQASLRQWNRELGLEEAALRDPVRIYNLAENDLGMGSAQPGQVLTLDSSVPAGERVTPELAESRPAAPPRMVSVSVTVPR